MDSEGSLGKTIRDSILILLFEFLGTLMTCLLYNNVSQTVTESLSGKPGSPPDYAGLLLGIFVLLIFGAKISGSHYNPAVTLGFMLRRDVGRFSRILGIAYILFQLGGAFCGALAALMVNGKGGQLAVHDGHSIEAMGAEVLGSFFIVFMFLTQTEDKTKLAKDPAITTLIIASSQVTALIMTSTPYRSLSCLNPAIGVSTVFIMLFKGDTAGIADIWILAIFPFIGAILAVIFHEFVYKKVQEEVEEQEDDNEGILDNNKVTIA